MDNYIRFQARRDHEEICSFKPVQCPELDCTTLLPISDIFRHFRSEHSSHFVNAHGSVFNGDIRCDDTNMVMGVERKWAPTMMKLDQTANIQAHIPHGKKHQSVLLFIYVNKLMLVVLLSFDAHYPYLNFKN